MHKQFGNLILAVGILLLTAALFLVSHNMAEENRAEAAVGEVMPALSEAIAAQLTSAPPAATDDVPEPGKVPDVEEIILIDGEAFLGYLTIDALSLSLPVRQVLTERNLKQSPCRYAGCAGTRGFVIAAHNYRRHLPISRRSRRATPCASPTYPARCIPTPSHRQRRWTPPMWRA